MMLADAGLESPANRQTRMSALLGAAVDVALEERKPRDRRFNVSTL